MQPTAELIMLPPEYGESRHPLAWEAVRTRLEEAPNYWLATPRPDGRPHVVPLDGIWLDAAWYFGGSPATVHMKNAARHPTGVMHTGDGLTPIIVEGAISEASPTQDEAERLSEANNRKYAHYGMKATADTYLQGGVYVLRAERVLVWNHFPADATRFVFV